jgi:hypothetical protein
LKSGSPRRIVCSAAHKVWAIGSAL